MAEPAVGTGAEGLILRVQGLAEVLGAAVIVGQRMLGGGHAVEQLLADIGEAAVVEQPAVKLAGGFEVAAFEGGACVFGSRAAGLEDGGQGVSQGHGLSGRLRREGEEGQRQHERTRGGAGQGADDPGEHEEEHTQTQRPCKTLNRAGGLPVGRFLLREAVQHRLQGAAVQRLQSQFHESTARGGGKLLQHAGLKLGSHHVVGIIADVITGHLGIRNQRAALCTDTDADDDDAGFRQPLDVGHEVLVLITAVAENDEREIPLRQVFDGAEGDVEQIADVAAAPLDDGVVEGLQGFDDGVVVGRQGRLQVGATGKGQQPHAFPGESGDEVVRGEACAGEPVRRHVPRQHGA